MKVSLSWLKDYVDIDMPVDKLADLLTMVGLEVESVEDRYAYLDKVVVGHIIAIAPHPNAKKLNLCRVQVCEAGRDGEDVYQVVCGAPNSQIGMLAPFAMPGAVLPGGMEIAAATIRGETSQGMLCSVAEIGLGTDRSGLMVLDKSIKPGTPLKQALNLNDATLEVSLTPNRADCLSVMGVAREIAGFLGVKIRRPDIRLPQAQGDIRQQTSITIDAPDHCPRYSARLVEGLTVGPSPFWLQDRLMSVGLRPINNLVDITNFILMETGQPLHAFDFDHLEENRIVVRTAKHGEFFTTLDGKTRILENDMLMICDGCKPVAIGGVMGGLNSEIEDGTTRVLIESAYFNPISTRKTAKRLGLNTEASHRFERGVDPHGTLFAIDRAVELMAELGNGRLVKGTIDVNHTSPQAPAIELSVAATNRLLGTDLDIKTIASLLEAIEFGVELKDEGTLSVTTPSYRVDISRPEDLMEEVARRHGYDLIPVTFPAIAANRLVVSKLVTQRPRIRGFMTGMGFFETINYSFIHKASPDRLQLPENDERRRTVPILNPLTEDQAVMRTSLIPGLLEAAQRNLSRQSRTLKFFESGKVFIGTKKDSLPQEKEILAGLWTGGRGETGWYAKSEACDFYDIKGAVEALFAGLRINTAAYTQLSDDQCYYTRTGATARILIGGQCIGLIGEIDNRVRQAYELKQPVFIFEIDLGQLIQHIPDVITSRALPRYPSTTRDATLIVDNHLETGAVLDHVLEMKEPLIEAIKLFDLFEGRQIPRGCKSISLRITYRSLEKTLEDETVNQLHRQITDGLVAVFRAELPA